MQREVVVYSEIVILLVATFAFAYIIHNTDKAFESLSIQNNNKENKIISLLLKQIDLIPSVSAQSDSNTNLQCCVKTKQGAICQDMLSSSQELCNGSLIPTKCDQVSSCKIGCCIDSKEGLCTTRSTQQSCSSNGGTWKDDASCLVQECQKGCCILGDNVQFSTDQRCTKLSSMYGLEKDFRDVSSEVECLTLKNSQETGACVVNNKCSTKVEPECLGNGGKFYKDTLCSNPELNTTCEKQTSIGCVEGKDEIYWFDSCGNKENIYYSDKNSSYNNGLALSKEKSCSATSENGNANSATCGNCDYFKGSRCVSSLDNHVKDGNYICKQMDCSSSEATGNKERKNGESWCIYDGVIGDGKDSAGSRNWKRICVDGEVKVEPCEDYRGEICVQSDIKDGSKTFSTASCKTNDALACINYNTQKNVAELCDKNQDCTVKHVNVDKGFKFDMCVSQYPRGFDLINHDISASDELCKLASAKCTMVYQKKITGKWKCVYNCKCSSETFTQQMNDVCISMGDCGSNINYIGEGTDNIKVIRAPLISYTKYKQNAIPVQGRYIEVGDLNKTLDNFGIPSVSDGNLLTPESRTLKSVKLLGNVAGGLGTFAKIVGFFLPVSSTAIGTATISETAVASLASEGAPLSYAISPATSAAVTTASHGGLATAVTGFSSVFGGISVGMTVSLILTKLFGLQGDAALAMAIAGFVAGGVIGIIVLVTGQTLWSCLLGGICLVIIGVLILIAVLLTIFGIGKTKKVIVSFDCLPWQAPPGGSSCDKCNGDPLKPCSEYRCSSLGQACKLLNPDAKYPTCVEVNAGDHTPPKISPSSIMTGYRFESEQTSSVSVRKDNGACIPEFTTVRFSLKTDEYAQCVYSFQHSSLYDETSNSPLEGTAYTINHTLAFMMPSKESLADYEIPGIDELFGNLNLYVRCRDNQGNFNLQEYGVNICVQQGPDITPPLITSTNPKNNGFIQYNITEIPLTVFLNEPAECKYDKNDKEYDTMSNSMICSTELEDAEIGGWPCNTTLTNTTKGDNTIFIRCKDQPWFVGENDTKRNKNIEGYVYTLKSSEKELKIDSIVPSGELSYGSEPMSIDTEVKTLGGAEDGKAECSYSFSDENSLIQFYDTFSSNHKQHFNLMSGDYNILIECKDVVGNTAIGNAIFSLKVDTFAPIIVRIYNDAGQLKVITNEKAECFYDPKFKKCNFNIDNATKMTTAFSNEHTAEWIQGKTYYIKCRDIYGNTNSNCAIKAVPSSDLLV